MSIIKKFLESKLTTLFKKEVGGITRRLMYFGQPLQNFYYSLKREIVKKYLIKFPPYNMKLHDFLNNNSWDPIRYATMALAINTIKIEDIEGSFAEVGVYRGAASKIIHTLAPEKRLYLFDTFEGFPENYVEDKEDDRRHRFMDTSVEYVKKVIGDLNNVIIKKGIFPKSAEGLETELFSFVFLDMDLYKSTLEGLKYFYPRLVKGGYIFIHDYNNPSEFNNAILRATKDFMVDKPESIIEIPDRWGSAIFRKI